MHHSELQRRSSWQLLSKTSFQGDENILDIGCRDGKNTAWMACLVRQGKVLGIDPSNTMIHWAQKQHHPLEFPNLSFQLGDFTSADILKESYDIVTSFFSLHLVQDKVSALKHIYSYLKPKGKFACVTPPIHTNLEYDEAVKATMLSPLWKKYFSNFTPTFQFMPLEEYKSAISAGGFELIEGDYFPSVDPFINTEAFISWFKGTMPHIHYMPEEMHDAFVQDLLNHYLMLRPEAKESDGTLNFYWGRFEFLANRDPCIT